MALSAIWKLLPPMDSKFAFALLISHSIVAFLCIIVMLLFKSGRKKLRKYWKLSQQGPFYRLGAFISKKIFQLFVTITRPVLGNKFIPDPKQLSARFTSIKTQSDRIILNWSVTGPQSSWSIDEHELQVSVTSPHAGKEPSEIQEWETLQKSQSLTYDYKSLTPGTTYIFRVRIINQKGASDWTSGEFGTRQLPVENGGRGPGYTWKQTTKEVQALVYCRSDARAKDLAVECKANHLRIEDRGKTPPAVLLDGALSATVKAGDVAWTLSDDGGGGRRVIVTVEKQQHTKERKEHWLCLIQGHPFVDRRFLPEGTIDGKLES